MAVQNEIDEQICYGDPALTGGLSVFSKEFDEAYRYDGDDLGCRYSSGRFMFALWAPTAELAYVVFYDTWDGPSTETVPLVRGDRGVWRAAASGDRKGKLYTYRVKIGPDWSEAVDPYAKAVSVNGERGVVADMADTNPDRWTEDKPSFVHPTDAVIYEAHIRDMTIHPASGASRKGTYLGACEKGTKGPGGIPTGLDHILSLGVTHVEFLPMFDFRSETPDERNPHEVRYNWGYDPQNNNVPEGWYSTNPYDPLSRIRELKRMIQTYHDNGLRVIMDVVYNHVHDGVRSSFMKLVPGYYFRFLVPGVFSDGSGCGNDTASERSMMRRFMIDSVVYWAKEYHVDGFRFDLMGLHDVETMNEIRRRLDEVDPTILMLGEGWKLPTPLPDEAKACQMNAGRMPRIGMFNDALRDGLKGSIFYKEARGWVNGEYGCEPGIRGGITASVPYEGLPNGYASEPCHSVAYVESHDNHTLWDKLKLANPGDSEETLGRMHMLASAVVLTSQGIPFLHAGQEFMRSKYGVENSYRSSDDINRMEWDRCAGRQDAVDHIRKLIALRRRHPAFRLQTADEIRRHLTFVPAPGGCIAYLLNNHAGGDPAEHLFVVHNANRSPVTVNIPVPGRWRTEFGLEHAGPYDRVSGGPLQVEPLSTVVLASYEGGCSDGYHV